MQSRLWAGPRTRVRRHSTTPDPPWIATSSCSTPKLGSRHLDSATGWLKSQNKGYYTIGSPGHEGNAAVASALRPTDPSPIDDTRAYPTVLKPLDLATYDSVAQGVSEHREPAALTAATRDCPVAAMRSAQHFVVRLTASDG